MKIALLGTGMVAQTLAGKLDSLGHQLSLGTRDVAATLAKTAPDGWGNPAIGVWLKNHPGIKLLPFAQAAAEAELVFNLTSGQASLAALQSAGAAHLAGKILVDLANPLDFSQGMPPSLTICNTDSLGERIQAAFPQTKVVKTLNTMTAALMVNPAIVAGGNHTVFVSGNDASAKAEVTKILQTWFGWTDVIDLGDITTARGTEMVLPLWVRTMNALQTPLFGLKVAR